MQPCGLRDLARPRRRQSFGLKTKRFAGYARGTLAQRGLKNIHATLRAAGFGAPWGRRSFGLKAGRVAGYARGTLAERALKNIHATLRLRDLARPWGRRSFGLKAGQVAECIRRTLAEKALKKRSCRPADCENGHVLGGDGRLASKPSDLRAAPAAPWPKGSKKTFVQPCGLRDLACP